jgi:hypothetical protein
MSKRDEDKALWERKIFCEFAMMANLQADEELIQSEEPPRPDISCVVSGQRRYFELVEVTDEKVAESYSLSIKHMQPRSCSYSNDNPLIRAFESKSKKTYETLNGSLELLAYYDKQPSTPWLKDETLENVYRVSQEMLQSGPWRRIWLYDSQKKQILWHAPDAPSRCLSCTSCWGAGDAGR